MAKAEWGTKRTCPKCGNRFYDLTKDEPVTCISCSYAWYPEPVLKSKQPVAFDEDEAAKQQAETQTADTDLSEDLIDEVDDGDVSPDDEVDLGGDDDLGVDTADDKDDN